MKVAYISNHNNMSGYSDTAIGHINSLRSKNVNMSVRNVDIVGNKRDNSIDDYGTLNDIDVCIQHTLPDFYQKTNAKKNIGIFCWETTLLPNEWVENINKSMDAVIVSNKIEASKFNDQLDVPVYCVNHSADINDVPDEEHGIKADSVNEDTHIFYTISSVNPRKGLEFLVMSYLSEFKSYENCVLFMHSTGSNEDTSKDSIMNMINGIKKGLKLDMYPKIMVNTRYLSYDNVMSIHYSGDTYISLSRGESWNIPLFTARAHCRNIIATACDGHLEYLDIADDWVVNGNYSPVIGMHDSPSNLYKGNANWITPDVSSAKKRMRECFSRGKSCYPKIDAEFLSNYSHEAIGTSFCEVLEDVCKD